MGYQVFQVRYHFTIRFQSFIEDFANWLETNPLENFCPTPHSYDLYSPKNNSIQITPLVNPSPNHTSKRTANQLETTSQTIFFPLPRQTPLLAIYTIFAATQVAAKKAGFAEWGKKGRPDRSNTFVLV